MTLKEKVFQWFDEHPEELKKVGYGSNTNLREAFPKESRKTLSMYKMQYKRAHKKVKAKKVKEKADDIKKKVEDASKKFTPKNDDSDFELNLDLKLIIIPILLFIFWMIFKSKKE